MRLRNLFEANTKTAVIGFGRMNPPTIGHGVLVDAINSKAKQYGGNPMLFLTMSQTPFLTPKGKTSKHYRTANIKNPLDWKTKLSYAQKFFNIPISTDPSLTTIMSVMKHLENKGYEKVVLVCGSDRVKEFESQILPYNNTPDQSGNIAYNIKEVSVEEGGFRDEEANDASGMSASKMREAAAQDDFESFKQGVPDQSVAQQMFDDVRNALGFSHDETTEEGIGDIATKVADKVTQGVNSILGKIENWYNSQKAGDDLAWAEVELLLKPYARELLDLVQDKRDMQMLMFLLTRNQINKGFIRNLFDKIKRKGLRAVYKMEKEFGGFATESDEDVNELNLFKKTNNADPKQQDSNKLKVLDWVGSRNDGKEHFLSFFVKGTAWSGRLIFIKPEAAKTFMKKVEDNPEHEDRIKKMLTSVETTSKLFTQLKIDHQVRRAS